MLKNALFCALLTLISQTISAQSQARWLDHDYIKSSFLDIALGREYEKQLAGKLIRWRHEIKIHLESNAGNQALQKELLSTHTQHLASITGHPITFDVPRSEANISIVFTRYKRMRETVAEYIGDPKKYEVALKEAICIGTFSYNGRGEIFSGTIIIPVDYARQKARFLDCIVEEITQLLGLPNDSDKVFPSIFNDNSIDAYLSPLDYILLKLLYSDQLQAGMSHQSVLGKLDLAIADLDKSGDLEGALYRVNQQSLKSYLGD